jgi:glyoxylate reductase
MNGRSTIAVTVPLPDGARRRIEAAGDVVASAGPRAPTPAALARLAADADGLLCGLTDVVDAALLAACPRLRVVSSVSVGVDHVDVAAATARGVAVGHTPGVLVETTADLAFALLLAAARRVAEGDRWIRAGGWTAFTAERGVGWSPDLLLGRDVHGATLGLVGLGAIACAVARRAQGFGMRVLGWSRRSAPPPGVAAASLDALLAASDFVSVHVARTPDTIGLLGRDAIARMKRGAILVNTARGGIVDEDALAEALAGGRLAAAGLDVFASEPLAATSPLLALENVVLTPHVGSASVATRARMLELALDNLLAGLAGALPPRCANPEVAEAPAWPGRRAGR